MKKLAAALGVSVILASLAAFPACADETQAATAPVVGDTSVTAGQTSRGGITEHSVKTSQLDSFKYHLYTPQNATENMPLIVYLHSASMVKNPGKSVLSDGGFPAYLQKGGKSTIPAYVVLPSVPLNVTDKENKDWLNYGPSLVELINTLSEEYKIDKNRISLTGYSMGGDGAIAVAANYPDVFSCTVPVAPFYEKNPWARFEEPWAEGLKTVPIWFLCEGNETGQFRAKDATEAINQAGGEAYHTVVPNATHSSMQLALFESGNADTYNIIDWMISQNKTTVQQ